MGGFLLGFMIAKRDVSEDMRRRAFDYYAHHETVPLNTIATFLGVSRDRFLRLRREWNWPPRGAAIAAAAATAETHPATLLQTADAPSPPRPSARTDLRDAAHVLAQVTRARLDDLITDQLVASDVDHDRTARTLAAYAKTLTIAQSLLEQDGTSLDDAEADAHQPRSIHDLRDELACHLERIVAEEEAHGGDGILV